jgi:DNA-binding response OmpR family regulator
LFVHAVIFSQDPDETALISFVLQRVGLTVGRVRDLDRVLQAEGRQPLALIVLVAVDQEVVTQVRRIRAQLQVPLVVVGENLEESVQTLLLDSGADLVVLRPFSARLLIAQVRAVLRRAGSHPFFTSPPLTIGGLTLDPTTRTFQVERQPPKRLTRLEFRLLHTLMLHRGQVLPAEVLVEHVWGYAGEGERDLVRGLVSRLRSKVEPDPREPRYVLTVPGVGYTFEPQD